MSSSKHVETLHEDREIVLAAVQQNGFVLQEAHDDFIYDKEVMHAAVKQNWKVQLGYKVLATKHLNDIKCTT